MTKTMIIIVGGLLPSVLMAPMILHQIWRFYKKKRRVPETFASSRGPYLEMLKFSKKNMKCRDHAIMRVPCEDKNCSYTNFGRKLVWYLKSPAMSLDVCTYMITCDDLTNAIIATHKRDIPVRVIVDSGMSKNPATDNQLTRMRRAGIEVRMNADVPSSLMHHKFAVIDGRTAIYGSANWTMQAFSGNYDSIAITNISPLAETLSEMFEEMWCEFGPDC